MIKSAIKTYETDNNIVKRKMFEEHLKTLNVIIYKGKKRITWKLVKQIGSNMQPNWIFKY
ncbi:MAG: hypothetical protein ACRCZ0_08045 [Cetobacterium sp.]